MKGVGKTVFQGDRIEEFQVEIPGILENIAPRQSAILAKVSGGPLERTGVMAGMSGSPIYIDGKIVGALSFTFPFSKEAIAGITPIQQMVEIFDKTEPVRTAPSVFFDPGDKYIWDMVFDSKGTLFAAAGSKGRLYKISREGKGEVFFESGQTNLMCLALDGNGQILAGSEPDGHLYRIAPDGKPFVLYDSSLREIHQIQTDAQESIYFIAIGGPSTSVSIPPAKPWKKGHSLSPGKPKTGMGTT